MLAMHQSNEGRLLLSLKEITFARLRQNIRLGLLKAYVRYSTRGTHREQIAQCFGVSLSGKQVANVASGIAGLLHRRSLIWRNIIDTPRSEVHKLASFLPAIELQVYKHKHRKI